MLRKVKFSDLPTFPAPDSLWNAVGERGPVGPASTIPGPKGDKGESIKGDDGQPGVGFDFKGNWQARFEYAPGDIVRHADGLWAVAEPSKGRTPRANSTFWRLLIKDGQRGERGPTGWGGRGPRGFQGESGTSSGGSVELPTFTFDVSALAGQVVRVSGNKHVSLSDADNFPHAVGFAVADTANGESGEVITDGELQLPTWASVLESGDPFLVPETIYYLSTVSGKITPDAPEDGGEWVVRLGTATGNTTLSIEIEAGILLSGNTGDGESSELLSAIFDSNAELGMPLYVSGSGTVDLADASNAATAIVAGLSAEQVDAAATGFFKSYGTLSRVDWSDVLDTGSVLVPGSQYFLATTPGKLTLTPPASIGESVVICGLALTEQLLSVSVEPPMLLT